LDYSNRRKWKSGDYPFETKYLAEIEKIEGYVVLAAHFRPATNVNMASASNRSESDQDLAASDEFDFLPHGSSAGASENDDLLINEVNEEDIRRMAEALAPQMSELEDVLKDISASGDDVSNALELAEMATQSMRDEDDDMDDELQQLAMSEQALREELQFALDINALLSPSKDEEDEHDNTAGVTATIPVNPNPVMVTPTKQPSLQRIATDPPIETRPPAVYTLQDHADHLKLYTEKIGGWYYCDMSQYIDLADNGSVPRDLLKDYCLPIPFRKLKRLYSGLMYHQVASAKAPKQLATPAKIFASPAPKVSHPDPSIPNTPVRMPAGASTPSTPATPSNVPPPPPPPPAPHEEPLPVRTVSIRIRPDVLCGAVMDAMHHAFEILPNTCTSRVLKRQGGHLRGAVYMKDKSLAYVVDAQLCTQKNDELERRLLVRFYHVQDDPEAMQELGQALQQKAAEPQPSAVDALLLIESSSEDNNIANGHMKQSCSLIQRLMAAQQQGSKKTLDAKQQASWLGLRDHTAFTTKSQMQNAVAMHLESNFKSCPSVREENKKATPTIRRLTLPSLSGKDWILMEVSWSLTSSIMEELDTRDCTYNTIYTLPFGQFPSLPTLDVHYCSQLRRLSRESMINQLLKSAKELEDYAKGAEYNCAVCITLLTPMLARYGIPPVELPISNKTLQEYPLDYTLPQVVCPPWGSIVMEALNQVAAKTPTGEIAVLSAVKMVYDAFIKQDDEEQAARLGRKNAQIIDRLATLQTHQRALVQNLRDAHIYSEKAAREAAGFLKSARKAINAGRPGYPNDIQPEVPLLSFRVSQGASSSGTCYVSACQILFVTSYIPLVGGNRAFLFDLELIDFQVDESVPATLLNPFPNTMNVVLTNSNEVVYSFRPVVAPTRLHKFLKVIQSFTNEERPSEFSQVVDGVEAVEEDGEVRLSDSQLDDQLEV
jgi:hypothetical protein